MSRPASRLSATSSMQDQRETTRQRPSSANSINAYGVGVVPQTPGPPVSGASRAVKTRHSTSGLGLSARELDRAEQVLRSVQKKGRELVDGPTQIQQQQLFPARRNDLKGKQRALDEYPNGQDQPDASRPRRTTTTSTSSNDRLKADLLHNRQAVTSTHLRQILASNSSNHDLPNGHANDEDDDEADLKQYTEHEEDENPNSRKREKEDISDAGLEIQEALLMEDLLTVIIGIQGQFITFDPDYSPEDAYDRLRGARFVIDEEIDPSLCDLAARILPLAQYYTSIAAFIDIYRDAAYGRTNQALCAALRAILRDQQVLVAQLEYLFMSSTSFSLQRFYTLAQPMMHKLSLVYNLVQNILASPADMEDASTEDEGEKDQADEEEDDDDDDDDRFGGKALKEAIKGMRADMGDSDPADKDDKPQSLRDKRALWISGGIVRGGEVLSIIDELLQRTSGNPVAKQLYSDLLLKSSQPYARILIDWISKGQLDDPNGEFMICEAKSLDRTILQGDYTDEYWEKKYTLRDASSSSSTTSSYALGAGTTGDSSFHAGGLLDGTNNATSNTRGETDLLDKRIVKREKGLGGGAIIPSFLEQWKYKILLAGKYLNVIRESGASSNTDILQTSSSPAEQDGSEPQDIAIDSVSFGQRINTAYLSANTALLDLLIQDQSLFLRLKSLKHTFFMDQGDSFTHFLDLASHELSKKAKHVSISKLQSLLDVALRNPSSTGGTNTDPYKEDIKIAISNSTLIDWLTTIIKVEGAVIDEQGGVALDTPASANQDKKADESKHSLTGIEALSLDYNVEFPLSLVISRKAILNYQLIFRHLLSLKHLEQVLTTTWTEHTKSPAWRRRTNCLPVERWKRRVFTLRTSMLAFVQQMYSFAVSDVLDTNWRKMMDKLQGVRTVDQLLKYHSDFLQTSLEECMLTNHKMLKLQSRLIQTCNLFAQYASRLAKTAGKLNSAVDLAIANGEDLSNFSVQEEDDFLKKFELNFYKHQKTHADTVMFHALSDTSALLALVVKLATTVPESEGPA